MDDSIMVSCLIRLISAWTGNLDCDRLRGMLRCEHHNLNFYQFESFTDYERLIHGVFTRQGGVSEGIYNSLNVGSTVGDDLNHVMENRRRIAKAMGVAEEATRTTWQVHGAEILAVDRDTPPQVPSPPQADGIITHGYNVPLVMRFADCVPLFLYDPVQNAIGVAHAGWKGTLLGVGPATVHAMIDHYGSKAEDIIAGIGPSIGPCCYEVGQEVVDGVKTTFGSTDELVTLPHNGGPHLDLWKANEQSLRHVGVQKIEIAALCTSCNTDEFFSHRRERSKTGRFGVVLGLCEN